MRFPLAFALFAAVLFLAVGVLKLGEAAASRRTPLTGAWSAEFRLDSLHPPSWEPRIRAVARQSVGMVQLDPGLPDWLGGREAFWRVGFRGTHSVDFVPLLGFDGSRAPEAIGLRFDADSVHLHLNGYCCHTGGVWARGRLLGDSITGEWVTDSDGWGAWGRFVLRRSRSTSTRRPPNEALKLTSDLR